MHILDLTATILTADGPIQEYSSRSPPTKIYKTSLWIWKFSNNHNIYITVSEWPSLSIRMIRCTFFEIILGVGVRVMGLNIAFNNISLISWRLAMLVISWRLVILGEETGLSGENHRPVARHWQTLPRNVLSSTPPDNTDKISIGLKSTNKSQLR